MYACEYSHNIFLLSLVVGTKKKERRESTLDYLSQVNVKSIMIRQLVIAIQQGRVAVTPLELIQHCLYITKPQHRQMSWNAAKLATASRWKDPTVIKGS